MDGYHDFMKKIGAGERVRSDRMHLTCIRSTRSRGEGEGLHWNRTTGRLITNQISIDIYLASTVADSLGAQQWRDILAQ